MPLVIDRQHHPAMGKICWCQPHAGQGGLRSPDSEAALAGIKTTRGRIIDVGSSFPGASHSGPKVTACQPTQSHHESVEDHSGRVLTCGLSPPPVPRGPRGAGSRQRWPPQWESQSRLHCAGKGLARGGLARRTAPCSGYSKSLYGTKGAGPPPARKRSGES